MRQSAEKVIEDSIADMQMITKFIRKTVELQETFDNASIYKESLNFTKDVVDLTRSQSNDMELGAAIRQYVNNNAK